MLRNKCFFQVRILRVLRLISICDLFTDSDSCVCVCVYVCRERERDISVLIMH